MALAALGVGAAGDSRGFGALDTTGPVPFWVERGAPETGYRTGDARLARWALDQWSRASGGRLQFEEASEAQSLIRVHFGPPRGGLYGEARLFHLKGRRGAAIFVRPLTTGLGPAIAARAARDPLFRDTIVFLTCLHELGHALGLTHTRRYTDIMYTFQAGGDIEEYFLRYRRRLRERADIPAQSGLSDGDVARLRAIYPIPKADSPDAPRQDETLR